MGVPWTESAHPEHSRIVRFRLEPGLVRAFLDDCRADSIQSLTYVPYSRLVLAGRLADRLGPEWTDRLRASLRDRRSGAITVGVEGVTSKPEEFVKFATAVGYLCGIPNFDAMSGNYFARFAVADTDSSDSYLRQAYRDMTLHTDGTYVEEETDWVLMMKIAERNAVGGRSRLLHLDDWADLERFSRDPIGARPFTYRSPPSKNVEKSTRRPLFFNCEGEVGMSFIDQFVYPTTIAEANYLDAMVRSLETAPAIGHVELEPGQLIVVNNRFWLHGREAFARHPDLFRELLRMRGVFATT